MTHPSTRRRRAFTLIEILVVIGIIVILAGILVPVIGRAMRQAKQTRTAADMQSIATALEAFKNDQGDYPRTADPGTGANLPNIGAAILGRYLNGPLGDGTLSGGGPDTGDPPAYNGATEYGAGDVVSVGTNVFVAIVPNSGVATSDPKVWQQCNGFRDGFDGEGIRMRQGGKKVGPFITADKMKMRGLAFIDGNGNPILYFPASPSKVNPLAPSPAGDGVYVNRSTNPVPTGMTKANFKYDADDNFEIFRRPGEVDDVVLRRIRALLGDYDGDGLIETNQAERVVTDAPYLLWAAGTDGKFGPDADLAAPPAVLNQQDVDKCDDVTNFRQ